MERLPVLQTERLILRSFEFSDAEALYRYAKSDLVGPSAGWKPHKSVNDSLRTIRMFRSEFAVWAIVFKENNEIIGNIGLSRNNRIKDYRYDLELGSAISENYWGKGIVLEACRAIISFAFDALNCTTLCASHFSNNAQSQRVLQKLGFVFQKTLPNSWQNYDGRYLDEEFYLLKNPSR